MWGNFDPFWQEAFALAWESFLRSTIPIGCVVVDEKNQIVARGKNTIFDTSSNHPLAGTLMAHAEMMALSGLQNKQHPNIRKYTLYTTLEPCPMCFGAMVMMHIRKIKYASEDGVAGSISLKSATPYLQGKPLETELGPSILQTFQVVLISAFELLKREHPGKDRLLQAWASHNPDGVKIAQKLVEEGYFDFASRQGFGADAIFAKVLEKTKTPQGRLC